MKKSKAISIGLLALSIAACTSNEKRQRQNVVGQPNYYVDNGQGYQRGGVSPMWIFWAYHMGSMGRVSSYPTYVHQSYGRNGSYHMASNGRRTTFSKSTPISRSSVSRGGFGSSGHSASS